MAQKTKYAGLHLWKVRVSVGVGTVALLFVTTSRDPSSAIVKFDAWVPGADYAPDEPKGVTSIEYEGEIDG